MDDDDEQPVGEIRKVESIFWIGDYVLHKCDQATHARAHRERPLRRIWRPLPRSMVDRQVGYA